MIADESALAEKNFPGVGSFAHKLVTIIADQNGRKEGISLVVQRLFGD